MKCSNAAGLSGKASVDSRPVRGQRRRRKYAGERAPAMNLWENCGVECDPVSKMPSCRDNTVCAGRVGDKI